MVEVMEIAYRLAFLQIQSSAIVEFACWQKDFHCALPAGWHRSDVVGRTIVSIIGQLVDLETGRAMFAPRIFDWQSIYTEKWAKWLVWEVQDRISKGHVE